MVLLTQFRFDLKYTVTLNSISLNVKLDIVNTGQSTYVVSKESDDIIVVMNCYVIVCIICYVIVYYTMLRKTLSLCI